MKWPPYSWLRRDLARHPKLYLWQARIGSLLMSASSTVVMLMFGREILASLWRK